ncbi:dihydrofolate reductase family protein [Staphylococcus casei]|uniref:Dihydrofolate reductase family protein n=1 Tax=Staphylococcus casei TaxID=201828 RepID=A0ABZ2WB81_9STAP
MNATNKVILDLAVTLDGYIEGPNGEIDWCIMEPEMDFIEFLNQIDAIIYGRKSYDLWGTYTPDTHDISNGDTAMWEHIHSKDKYVFTHQSLANDKNTQFLNEDIIKSVNQIKQSHDKDIWLYGGSSIITTFIHHNLIDEYRLSIHPTILGDGKPLFENIDHRLNITLHHTHTYKSGVVQLIYRKMIE